MRIVDYVPEGKRFRGSCVLRYNNPEIKDRLVALYLKECDKANQPASDASRNTNPWFAEEPDYMISLMTMAESTFDPRIYETERNGNLGVSGDMRLLYLATVNPETTLEYLFESKCGYRIGTQKGHPDYFYHGETVWDMSVNDAYTLLSLMSIQSPGVLMENRDRVLAFIRTHLKHYETPRQVPYTPEPVYLKWQDYDVKNGAIDVLRHLGSSEAIMTIDEIIHNAPELDPKQLKGGPQGRYEQIRTKGLRVIHEIRQRTEEQG